MILRFTLLIGLVLLSSLSLPWLFSVIGAPYDIVMSLVFMIVYGALFSLIFLWGKSQRFIKDPQEQLSSERLNLLHSIDLAILAAKSPEETALAALEVLHNVVRYSQATVLLYQHQNKNFVKMASLIYDQAGEQTLISPHRDVRWHLSPGQIDHLCCNNTIEVADINNLDELANGEVGLRADGVRSYVNVPLNTGTEFIGFLNISWNSKSAFVPGDIEIANQVATSLAIAIRQSRLLNAEQRHRKAAEMLQEVTTTLVETLELTEVLDRILDYLGNVIPYKSISIFLKFGNELRVAAQRGFQVEEQNTIMLHLPELAHLRSVIKERKPIIIPDVHKDSRWVIMVGSDYIRCWMGVPLIVKERVIGVLNLDHSDPGAYTEDEARVVLAFTNQASIAIENARLFQETQRRLERLSALRTMERAINSSLDLRETLYVLLDQVGQLLHVNASSVLLLNKKTLTLDLQARRGFRTGSGVFPRQKIGEGLAGKVVMLDHMYHVPHLDQVADECGLADYLVEEEFVAYIGVPLKAKDQVVGVLELWHRQPIQPNLEWTEQLEIMSGQAAIAIENATLFEEMQSFTLELESAYDKTLEGWARALELRDRDTEGHTRRVIDLTLRLARELGIPERRLVHIRRGAMLHDIGKMGIPDRILLKPGSLDENEWLLMRRHPEYAQEMLNPIPFLRKALEIPLYHHERWDGSGYPRGLGGGEIPLAARIFAVVDVWDALLSDRPYRAAWKEADVRDHLEKHAGILYDPDVVKVFLRILDEMSVTREKSVQKI